MRFYVRPSQAVFTFLVKMEGLPKGCVQNMIGKRKYQWVDYTYLGLSGSRNQRQYRNLRFLAQEDAEVVRMRRKTQELRIFPLKEHTAA